jgi:hypothetical protein
MIPTPSKSALHCLSTLAFIFAGIAAAQTPGHRQPANLHVPHVDADFGKLPLSFEPNRGQTDPTVQFLARGSQYTVLLQPTAATLVLSREDAAARRAGRPAPATRAAVRMTLDGANSRAAMSPDRPLPGYVNYITGDKAKTYTGIPTYAATRAAGVYPGIDLVYYGTARQLEYDFVVSPKSDPSLIHLAIDGACAVVESNGDLRLQIGATSRDTDIVFHKPVLYQQVDGARQSIDGAFTVTANGEVGFHVGEYDHSRELVIDPIISYGSYFGGSGEDEINGSVLNASNQLYAVGQTFSPTLPSGTGEFQPARGANKNSNFHDGFVTKFSADGSTVLWTTYLSGSQDDFATSVAVNASDEAYVVGYTNSCGADNRIPGVAPNTAVSFPFTGDAIQTLCSPNVIGFDTYESNGGNYTTFLVKLSSDGKTELYGTPIGGSSGEVANSIVLDSTGRPYIVGQTSSTSYTKCATVGPHCSDVPSYPVDQHGNPDIGLANYPTTSNAFYSNTTEAQLYPTVCIGCPGTQDEQAYITILSADLHSFVYSSLIGGPHIGGCGNGDCNTNGIAVAINAAGQAFIGGNTSSAYWPTTAGAFATTCPNAGSANSQCPMTGWLAGFDPSKSGAASLLFSTYMNGSSAGADYNGNPMYPGGDVYGLAVDSEGNVVATGDTSANNFPTTSGTFQPACVQFGDGNGNTKRCTSAFVTKLSPTGATVWSTYFGPPTQPGNFVIGNSVALDANDNVFIAGTSTSPTLPLIHAISTNPAQNSDAFVFELSPTGSTELMGTYIGANGISVDNNALHLDSNLNAYFSGSIHYSTNGSESFPATPGAFSTTGLGGSADGWVMKLITQQQASVTALTVSPDPATPSQTVTLTATVTTPSTITGTILPTGVVTFYNGPTVIGTGTLNASGVATFTGTLAAATYNVTANYPGDAGFNSSVSTATSLTVSGAVNTTTALTVVPASAAFGVGSALTATVVAGTAPATAGSVNFTAGSVSLGTATVSAQGVATLTVKQNVGLYSVIASYAGTYAATTNPTGYAPSASAGVALTVTKATTTTVLTSSTASAGTTTSFTLTASVPAGATGTVTFFNGATSLGTGSVGTNGTATLTTSLAAAGSYSLTATYGGDTNYSGSTSAVLTQVIVAPGFAMTADPLSLTITRGSTGTTTLTLTPAGGYTGAITMSCGTLPSNATCSFSPMSVTLASAATTEVLTIGTGSSTAMLSAPHVSGRYDLIFSALTLWLPGSLLGLFGLAKRKKLSGDMRRLTLLAALCFLSMGAMSGCGGSPSNTGANETPAGSYTVSVTAAGPTGSPQSLNLTVVVQ